MNSNNVKTELIKTKRENEYIKVELYYSLGGLNYWNYNNEPRGYYVSARPVQIENRGSYSMESFDLFSGRKILVTECKRKSAKAEQEALKLYDGAKAELLKRYANDIAEGVA